LRHDQTLNATESADATKALTKQLRKNPKPQQLPSNTKFQADQSLLRIPVLRYNRTHDEEAAAAVVVNSEFYKEQECLSFSELLCRKFQSFEVSEFVRSFCRPEFQSFEVLETFCGPKFPSFRVLQFFANQSF
jgi:hypothetical protein